VKPATLGCPAAFYSAPVFHVQSFWKGEVTAQCSGCLSSDEAGEPGRFSFFLKQQQIARIDT